MAALAWRTAGRLMGRRLERRRHTVEGNAHARSTMAGRATADYPGVIHHRWRCGYQERNKVARRVAGFARHAGRHVAGWTNRLGYRRHTEKRLAIMAVGAP